MYDSDQNRGSPVLWPQSQPANANDKANSISMRPSRSTDSKTAYPLAVSEEFGKMGGPKGYTNRTAASRVSGRRKRPSRGTCARLGEGWHGGHVGRRLGRRGGGHDGGLLSPLRHGETHKTRGSTQGDAAEFSALDGFRCLELLNRSATRKVTEPKGPRLHPKRGQNRMQQTMPKGLAPFPPVSASAAVRVAATANPSLGATV